MNADQELLHRLSRKQIILTVTAGRTGTRFLDKLFSLLPGVYSLHEGEPDYKHVLRRTQTQPSAGLRFLIQHKLPAIAASPADIYVETSHLFCKGFMEPMLNLGLLPDIVLLRRPPGEVAMSLLERNTVPARTTLGSTYLLCPTDPNTLPLTSWEALSDYQLCFWYALEIERRQIRYREYYRQLGGRVFDTTARELNDPDRFIAMAEAFSIPVGNRDVLLRRHAEVAAVTHNRNPHKLVTSFDAGAAEEAVWERVAYYEPLLREHVADRYT